MIQGPHMSEHAMQRWLSDNRQHRMDAFAGPGVFDPNRQAFHRARYEFAAKYSEGGAAADIACGLGYGSRILRQAGTKTVMGIDLCPDAISYARCHHALDGINYTAADATQIPVTRSSFDLITSFETVEHVPDTTGLLTEFARVLKPGGTLIISSPNDWGLTNHHCHTWTAFEFMAEIKEFFSIQSIWEQYSAGGFSTKDSPLGIKVWEKATEVAAECLVIVAVNHS